jgi:uncharacterized alkaline shock family protein YloU
VPHRPMTGRSLVTRRAIVDIVRGAVLGSYGVTGVDAGPFERLLGRLGVREPGIGVRLDRGLEIDLHLTVAYGVPVAEVARQVDSAVRYGIRRALDREVRRLAVHVGGLRYQPASVPPTKETRPAPATGDAGPEAARQATDDAVPAVEPVDPGPAGGHASGASAGDVSVDDPDGTPGGAAPTETGAAPVTTGGRHRRGHSTNGRGPG